MHREEKSMHPHKAALAAFGVLWASASQATAADRPLSYTRHITPFLVKYCMKCHNDNKAKSGYSVETYESLLEDGKRGKLVVPGDPDLSRLIVDLEARNG